MKPFELTVRLVSSLCKVLPNAPPEEEELFKIQGLWGETLSFQLAFTTTDPNPALCETALRFEVDSPFGDRVQMRSVVNVPVMIPVCGPADDDDYISKEAGMYPDLLTDLKPDRVRAIFRQWRSVWFDLNLDSSLAGGTYPLTIRVYSKDNLLLAQRSIEAEIIPAALPAQQLYHTEWFHGDCLADYYHVPVFSEEHWRIMENFIGEMPKHGINTLLTPLFTPPLDTAEGGERTTIQLVDIFFENCSYRFDFTKLDRYLRMAQNCGIKYFEMSHLFSQWGAKYAPKIFVHENGQLIRKFGWHTPAMCDEYKTFLSDFLPALTAHLSVLDLNDHVFFHISDEPTESQLEAYRTASDFVKPYLDGFKTLDALSDYSFYETGCVQRPACANNQITPFLEHHVSGLWTYYCTAQREKVSNRFIAMPSARNRILGIQLYLYNIEGFLHWGYNFYNTQFSTDWINPYAVTDAGDAFPAGDPYLVYPGRDGKPEGSLRLMVLCEALYDLRALRLLESLRSREFTISLINEGLDKQPDFANYPHSSRWLLDLRRRINEEIKKAL